MLSVLIDLIRAFVARLVTIVTAAILRALIGSISDFPLRA